MPSQARRERIRLYQKKIELRKLVAARVITAEEAAQMLWLYASQRISNKDFEWDQPAQISTSVASTAPVHGEKQHE